MGKAGDVCDDGVLYMGLLQIFSFSNRVINRWNQLDQRTVGAPTIIVFKGHLNKIRETMTGFFVD